MSYSRWGGSCWYTFWSSAGETDASKHIQDKQIFEICGTTSFTYGELKRDLEGCIDKLRQHIKSKKDSRERQDMFVPSDVTEEELEELKGYMREFMKDVEEDERFLDPLYEDLKKVKKAIDGQKK